MTVWNANRVVDQELGSADVIEALAGQCVVFQCNRPVGIAFFRSLTGEDGAFSACRVDYRGERLSLADPAVVGKIGISRLDDGLYERLKVREYLLFWAELYDVRTPIGVLLAEIGLSGKENERIAKLGYSEKRLLGLARSLLHDPDLIVWEDPEQNLDLESCMIVRKLIAERIGRDKAFLVTCSTLEQALSLSNRVFRLTESSAVPIAVQEQSDLSEPESGEEGEEFPTVERELPDSASAKLAKLMIKTEDKYVFVDPADIRYIESVEGTTCLYTEEDRLTCAWTLAELEERLKKFRFYRCHRSYIVNLEYLSELIAWSRNSYSLVLNDGKKSRVPLSKGKFEELKTMVGL